LQQHKELNALKNKIKYEIGVKYIKILKNRRQNVVFRVYAAPLCVNLNAWAPFAPAYISMSLSHALVFALT
jgi:hypothetical protein